MLYCTHASSLFDCSAFSHSSLRLSVSTSVAESAVHKSYPIRALRLSVSTSVAESAVHKSPSWAGLFPCSSMTHTVVMEASVAYQCLVLQKRCESSERCFAPPPPEGDRSNQFSSAAWLSSNLKPVSGKLLCFACASPLG